MTQVNCWECGKAYHCDDVFDIPVFQKGFTIKWCFDCAKKQLKISGYELVKAKKEAIK